MSIKQRDGLAASIEQFVVILRDCLRNIVYISKWR